MLRRGGALAQLGRRTEALAALQQATEILEPLLRDSPDRIANRGRLAEIYHQLGQQKEGAHGLEEALAAFEKAADHQRRVSSKTTAAEEQALLEVYAGDGHRLRRQPSSRPGNRESRQVPVPIVFPCSPLL